jgi:hypothetical protein
MPKNCSAKIERSQQLLLKVLNCLWTQYVSNRTSATKAYLASPTPVGYVLMASELKALGDLLNTNDSIKALDALIVLGGTPTYVNLSAVYASGVVAYLYSAPLGQNTYPGPGIPVGNELPIIVGSLKVFQILNTDECVPQALQVKPSVSLNPANYINQVTPAPVWVTEAIVAERSGCAGVSNTGFVGLSIEADITAFSFNTCPTLNCANSKCSK